MGRHHQQLSFPPSPPLKKNNLNVVSSSGYRLNIDRKQWTCLLLVQQKQLVYWDLILSAWAYPDKARTASPWAQLENREPKEVPQVQRALSPPPQMENAQVKKPPQVALGAHLECVEVALREAFFISELSIIYVVIVKENKWRLLREIAFSI